MVMKKSDHARIFLYVDTVRKLRDVSQSQYLLLLSGGREINKLSSRLKTVGRRYGQNLPNTSRVRKIGATCVELNLDERDARLVTRQMSHSASTSAAYYQAIVGDKHAAGAFSWMYSLREGRHESPTSSTCPSDVCSIPRRRLFSVEETSFVETFFATHIDRRCTPTIGECRCFLEKYPMPRTPKNIQDKVKTSLRNR